MTKKIQAYEGTFIKRDGEERTMKFVKIKDLPKEFVEKKIKGTGPPLKLNESYEVVWAVDANGFRIFNWDTTVGEVKQTSVKKSIFMLDK